MKNLFFFILLISAYSCNQEYTNNENLKSLDKLKEGNKRFISGYPTHPNETLKRLRELKKGQKPFVVVLSCSDSRVPPELIFDQGLGDIFTIRNAGNVIGEYELGSIEYAVEHLNCKLVIVLGHQKCGAVEAFVKSENNIHKDHVESIIEYLKNEEEEIKILDSIKINPDLAVKANIKHGVATLKKSKPILKKLFDENRIKIIGAYYFLDTGRVIFYE